MIDICIIIRVFNRLEDLENCIDIIRKTWNSFEYYIIVVSNGMNSGYHISEAIKMKCNKVLEIKDNAGHLKGNAQLLWTGIKQIPQNCEYTIILEADTWIYGDELIKKSLQKLIDHDAIWASAKWYNYVYSLSTDFAVIKSNFIINHQVIFDFTPFPELSVAKYIKELNVNYLYIKEIKPVNLPRYVKWYPFTHRGRFNIFFNAKMVTHHIEELKGGILQKKYYFNMASNTNYFSIKPHPYVLFHKLAIKLSIFFSFIIPHKSWFIVNKQN